MRSDGRREAGLILLAWGVFLVLPKVRIVTHPRDGGVTLIVPFFSRGQATRIPTAAERRDPHTPVGTR